MKVVVRNVSRLVTKDKMEKLFSIIGKPDIFQMQVDESDGSLICTMFFENLSEVFSAVALNDSFLGDSAFKVNFDFNEEHYKQATIPSTTENSTCSTIFIGNIGSNNLKEILNSLKNADQIVIYKIINGSGFVEFSSPGEADLAVKALRSQFMVKKISWIISFLKSKNRQRLSSRSRSPTRRHSNYDRRNDRRNDRRDDRRDDKRDDKRYSESRNRRSPERRSSRESRHYRSRSREREYSRY